MRLAQYLETRSIKRVEFAARIGVSPAWITALCDGTGWPSRDVADKIQRETAGDVTPDDFLPTTHPEQVAS